MNVAQPNPGCHFRILTSCDATIFDRRSVRKWFDVERKLKVMNDKLTKGAGKKKKTNLDLQFRVFSLSLSLVC